MRKKRRGKFFEEQKKLFHLFTVRRQKGKRVTYLWLKTKMKFICQQDQPDGYDPNKHKFTDPWCRAYCLRWRISVQRKTNKKSKSAFERVHLVSNFLYYVIYLVAKHVGNEDS